MSGPRRIGILGGMGPEATVELMSRLIAATPARDDFDHIPLLVDMNPQVPSRIARLIEGAAPIPGRCSHKWPAVWNRRALRRLRCLATLPITMPLSSARR